MAATNRGILVDKECHERLRNKYETEIDNLQKFLNLGAGWEVNVKSVGASGDVPKLLYNQLHIPPKTKRRANGTTTITTDKDAINELAAKHPHPLLLCILQIRERRDLIERYLNTAYDADGRMRCSFDITGTRSGRLSSRSSLSGSGTNLQNQPPDLREMFIPSPGKIFVYRDYSQAEARVVAYLADCRGLIELFEDPTRDIHKENASRIFNKPIAEVTYDTERYLAKRVVHAANYGMAEDRLVQVVNQDAVETGVRLDRRMAKQLLEAYFFLYPEIREVFWKGVERDLRATRTLTTAFGRKRVFFGRWDSSGKLVRDAYSFIPQGTVGDLGGMALVRCYNEIEIGRPELGAHLLLNVHDSILMECDIDHAETVAELMAHAMDIPIELNGYTFRIPTDCKVGFNWRDRADNNPRGLVDIEKHPDWRNILGQR
jgi:DNA polymerase-1